MLKQEIGIAATNGSLMPKKPTEPKKLSNLDPNSVFQLAGRAQQRNNSKIRKTHFLFKLKEK